MKLVLKENNNKVKLSEGLDYHIKNKLSIQESTYRIGSDAWCEMINEVRALTNLGYLSLNEDEQMIIESNAGEYGEYLGEDVPLDAPFLEYVSKDNKKLYGVFVLNENEKTIKVNFTEDMDNLKRLVKESQENYMFIQNLKSIIKKSQEILNLPKEKINEFMEGHEWAADHVSRAADDIEEVASFLTNKI